MSERFSTCERCGFSTANPVRMHRHKRSHDHHDETVMGTILRSVEDADARMKYLIAENRRLRSLVPSVYEYRIVDKNGNDVVTDIATEDCEARREEYRTWWDANYPKHAPHRVQRRLVGEWEDTNG